MILRFWAIFLAAFLLFVSPISALPQDETIISQADIFAWEQTAKRAEEAVAAGRASNLALEVLRNELSDWRSRFASARDVNQNTIVTLQSQLDALGPKPETGEEAPEISSKRSALIAELINQRAPVQEADLNYSRADGLIRSIDKIIRERQTDALLKIGPSPLNPANWAAGLNAVTHSKNNLITELKTAWSSDVLRDGMKQNLPVVIVLVLVAFVLLMRGRRWMEGLTKAILERAQKKSAQPKAWRWFLTFLTSLGQVVLPFLGIYALVEAIYATGMMGLRNDLILAQLPWAGLAFFLARWLGTRIFPRAIYFSSLLNLSEIQRKKGRLYSGVLGFLFGLDLLVSVLVGFDDWSDAAEVSVKFPMLIIAAYALFRLAQILHAHFLNDQKETAQSSYKNKMINLLSRAIIGVVAFGVVLGAVGYSEAAQFFIYSTALSLSVIASLLVLQRVVYDLYAIATRAPDGASEALTPVLISLVLVIASTPVFALIWGARLADLTELWAQFQQGFSLGDTRISPTVFVKFILIFIVGYLITRLFQGMLRNTVLPKTKIDVGGRNAIVSGTGYIGIFLAALIAITSAGIDLSSLAIVAGALSVGIGFGLQNIVSNFVSGIILLIERPISEGDWIEVGGQMGYVRDISVRSTRIETFDRTDVIVPNADLVSGMVTNWTRGNSVGRVKVPVGVAYGTDTRRVERILLDIAQAHPMVLANPAPSVAFLGFGADSLDFEIRAILRDVNWVTSVRSDMNHEIASRFIAEGIEIPFAQRDVWLRNPEVLNPKQQED